MTHFLEGLVVGLIGGLGGGYLAAKHAFNQGAFILAEYVLAGRKSINKEGPKMDSKKSEAGV